MTDDAHGVEIAALNGIYESAVKGRQDFRAAYAKSRLEVRELRCLIKGVNAETNAEIAALKEEITRLREALEGLLFIADDWIESSDMEVRSEITKARAALQGEGGKL
jgi:hypothetical protein